MAKALFFILCALIIVLSIAFIRDFINRPAPSAATTAGPKEPTKANAAKIPLDAARLLRAAQAEKTHPGIIERYACQIPRNAKEYPQAILEQKRAERILKQVFGPILRKDFARRLQTQYYENAWKIKCTVIEGKRPMLRMQYALFDETTAYWMSARLKGNTAELLKLGFHGVVYEGVMGEGSRETWDVTAVEQAEFGPLREKCEQVRNGALSPDLINATVKNPA